MVRNLLNRFANTDVTLQLISLLVLSDTLTSDNPENYEKVFPSDNGATGAQDSTSRTRRSPILFSQRLYFTYIQSISTGAARLDGIFADSTARETSFVELRHHDPNPIVSCVYNLLLSPLLTV